LIDDKNIVDAVVQAIMTLGLGDEVVAALSSRAGLASDRLRTDLREIIREELAVLIGERAPQADRLMSADEAAKVAGVASATVRRWVYRGDLPGHYAGRLLRVRLDELRAFLSRDRSTGEPVDVDRRVAEIMGGLGRKP
jgi:excisionase family DNA binding protein